MRAISLFCALAGIAAPMPAVAGDAEVRRGLRVSIIGGCHDCHTEGYAEAEGKIDPEKALRGSSIGWRSPVGTTYAVNLRILADRTTEREFVMLLQKTVTRPPMPWYNLRAMGESDMQSLYQVHKIAR